MKKIIMIAAILLLGVFSLSFSSCKKQQQPAVKPVITLTEVGHENSKKIVAGAEHGLHLEAKIVAEGLIKRIDVEIHQENGGKSKIEKSFTEGKYIGVKNADFHEHIAVPADTPAGKYHLHLTVADKNGNTATAESYIEVLSK